jgi:hypothetical protein
VCTTICIKCPILCKIECNEFVCNKLRHRLRKIAVTNRVTKMITSLEKQLQVINTELLLAPNDLNLLKSQMEVENKLELAKFDLTDVVEVKTTTDEGLCTASSFLLEYSLERAGCHIPRSLLHDKGPWLHSSSKRVLVGSHRFQGGTSHKSTQHMTSHYCRIRQIC